MSQSQPEEEQLAAKKKKRILTFIFLTVFLDLAGAGILIPTLPYLVRQFRTDATTIGLMSLAFSAAQFLASPVLGVLSDRLGRRPVLLFSILGSALGYFLFGWAGALWLMYLARIVDGVTGGNISTAQACIADISTPEERTKNFGLIGMAFGLGFICGPAIGGLVSKISLQAPAFAAAGLGVVTTLFGFFNLPETLPKERRKSGPVTWRDFNPLASILRAAKVQQIRLLLIVGFLIGFPFAAFQTNFSVFTLTRLGYGPDDNAWSFVYIGLAVAVMQGFVVRRLLPVWKERRMALVGFVVFIAGLLAMSMVYSSAMLYFAITLIAIGNGFVSPTLTALLSQKVSGKEQGSILGTQQSILSLCRVLGPVYGGWVFDHLGHGSPYWTGGIIMLVGLLIALPELRAVPPAGAGTATQVNP